MSDNIQNNQSDNVDDLVENIVEDILAEQYDDIDDLLDKLYDIDNYVDNDVLFESDDLLDEADEDDQQDTDDDDQQNTDDEQKPDDTQPTDNQDTDKDDEQSNDSTDVTPDDIMNIDKEMPDDNLPEQEPEQDEAQQEEDAKDRFLFNLKQLVRIRDLLNVASMKTKDVRFTALIKYVNKTLMTIANIGDDIYERDNLDDINKSLEEFATEVVKQAEEILDQYKDNTQSPTTTDQSTSQLPTAYRGGGLWRTSHSWLDSARGNIPYRATLCRNI